MGIPVIPVMEMVLSGKKYPFALFIASNFRDKENSLQLFSSSSASELNIDGPKTPEKRGEHSDPFNELRHGIEPDQRR
jgi:hypothetical protein